MPISWPEQNMHGDTLSVLEEILAEFDRHIAVLANTSAHHGIREAARNLRRIVSDRADKMREPVAMRYPSPDDLVINARVHFHVGSCETKCGGQAIDAEHLTDQFADVTCKECQRLVL
jgi:hypothetical protein